MGEVLVKELVYLIEPNFIDIGGLLEKLNSELEGQKIGVSGIQATVGSFGWYNELKAGYNERDIQAIIHYRLTQTTNHRLLGREKHFADVVVEKGIYPEHEEVSYERVTLKILRTAHLRGGSIIPPTRIDITVTGNEYDNARPYQVDKSYRHPTLENLLLPRWFVKPFLAEHIH